MLKSCDKSEQSVATTTSEQETGTDFINNGERQEVDTFEAAEDNVMFDSSQACCADEIAQIWNEIETTKKQQLSSKTEQLEAKQKYTDYQKLENELEDSKVKCTLYERKIQDLEDERAGVPRCFQILSRKHRGRYE